MKKRPTQNRVGRFFGAGDEARTRYLHLGKVALYRMSYTRRQHRYYNTESVFVNRYLIFFYDLWSVV